MQQNIEANFLNGSKSFRVVTISTLFQYLSTSFLGFRIGEMEGGMSLIVYCLSSFNDAVGKSDVF